MTAISMGCAGADGWQRLNRVPAQNIAESPRVAVATARAVRLNVGRPARLDLAESDGVVMIGPSRSYFEVVSLSIKEPGPIQIQVASRCDCFGFRKFLFVPLIAVFDDDGQGVPVPAPNLESKQADMSNPLRLVATWTLTVRALGTYRILVAADNSHIGSPIEIGRGSYVSARGLIRADAAAVGEFVFEATLLP